MARKYSITFLLLVLFICTVAGTANAGSSLQDQIDELKERLEVNEARLDEGEFNLDSLMEIGGYADMGYMATDKAGENNKFRVHSLNLQFKKQVSDTWSFFSEIEFEDAPIIEISEGKDDGKIAIESLVIQAAVNQQLIFRAGRYLTPAGIWNVDHYSPFVATMAVPEHIKKIFPNVVDGLQVFGSQDVGNTLVSYAVYAGNGIDEPGNSDSNENKAVGTRVKFTFHSLNGLELGLSGFTGKDKQTATQKYDRDSLGADVKFHLNKFKFQGEYARASIDDQISPSAIDFDRTGFYGQLIYDIKEKVSLVYRYDWYEANDTDSTSKLRTNTVALNYHFTPSVVGKLENHWRDPSSGANYNQITASVSIYFGKIGQ